MAKKLSDLWEKLLYVQDKMDKIIENIDNKFNNYHLILPFDIIEYDDHIDIKIDAPGILDENLKIYSENNLLIVEGIKLDSKALPISRYIIAERRFGKFRNIIDIPECFDIKNSKIIKENGVITIKINKIEEE
jgi:HSP20 family molecular chaperone IbpA